MAPPHCAYRLSLCPFSHTPDVPPILSTSCDPENNAVWTDNQFLHGQYQVINNESLIEEQLPFKHWPDCRTTPTDTHIDLPNLPVLKDARSSIVHVGGVTNSVQSEEVRNFKSPIRTSTMEHSSLSTCGTFETPFFGTNIPSCKFNPVIPSSVAALTYPAAISRDREAIPSAGTDPRSKGARDRSAKSSEERYKKKLEHAIAKLKIEVLRTVQILGADQGDTVGSKHATCNKAAELMNTLLEKLHRQELLVQNFVKQYGPINGAEAT